MVEDLHIAVEQVMEQELAQFQTLSNIQAQPEVRSLGQQQNQHIQVQVHIVVIRHHPEHIHIVEAVME